MPYKMPLRREKAARRLAASLKVHGELIATELAPRMAAVLEEGEEMPDVAHLLDVLGRIVLHESRGLDAADDARAKEGAQVAWIRRQVRDRLEPELRSRVIEVRDRMRQFYGAKETNLLLRHQGRTPRGLEDLEDLAHHMVRLLAILEPPKTAPGVTVSPSEWAEYLRPALDDLSSHLDRLGSRSEGEVEAVGVKKKALAAFDRTYRKVVRMGELFYELAGLDRLVKHLRTRTGRPPEQVPARSIRRVDRDAGPRGVA